MSLLDTFPVAALSERVPLGPMLEKHPKVVTPKSATLKRDHSPGPAQSERKRARTEHAGEREREKARLEADKFRKEWRRKFDGLVLFFDDALPHAREEFAERIHTLKGIIAEAYTDDDVSVIISNKPFVKKDMNKENDLPPVGTLEAAITLNEDPLLKFASENELRVWGTEKLNNMLGRLIEKPEGHRKKRYTEPSRSRLAMEHRRPLADKIQRRKSVPTPADPRTAALAVFDLMRPPPRPTAVNPSHQLGRLLQSEKLRGTTQERDPSAKRSDYRYFARDVRFVLCEDLMHQEATMWAHEYPKYPAPPKPSRRASDAAAPSSSTSKKSEKASKEEGPPWPELIADPRAYFPFAPYDEKAERRRTDREARQDAEQEEFNRRKLAMKRQKARARRAQPVEQEEEADADLDELFDGDQPVYLRAPEYDEVASGIGGVDASVATGSGAYWGASGNSMSLSAATTMNPGSFSALHGLGIGPDGGVTLPSHLHNILRPTQFPFAYPGAGSETAQQQSTVARPSEKKTAGLRRTKSVGGLRVQVHKKETTKTKSGFCENCRKRYEDLKVHVRSTRHIEFANQDANFATLDVELARVERRRLPVQ